MVSSLIPRYSHAISNGVRLVTTIDWKTHKVLTIAVGGTTVPAAQVIKIKFTKFYSRNCILPYKYSEKVNILFTDNKFKKPLTFKVVILCYEKSSKMSLKLFAIEIHVLIHSQ